LYSSHIDYWRRARDAGALAGVAVPRGRKRRDPQAERIARLEKEKQQLAKAPLRGGCAGKTARALGHDLRERGARQRVNDVSEAAVAELAPRIGVRAACDALGIAQASYYRRHRTSPAPARPTPTTHRDRAQPRALSAAEAQAILDELHSTRFADKSPTEVWASLPSSTRETRSQPSSATKSSATNRLTVADPRLFGFRPDGRFGEVEESGRRRRRRLFAPHQVDSAQQRGIGQRDDSSAASGVLGD